MSGAIVLPGSLNLNRHLSKWLAIHADGTVSVHTGKVELGQGIISALAQIVATELDVDIARIRMVAANTAQGPNEGVTAGSMSVHDSGGALRQVCAEVRAIYLLAAARHLQLDPSQAEKLDVVDGDITAATGERTSYWALADDSLLDSEASGSAKPKQPGLLGGDASPVLRIDIPAKVTGRPRFIQDMELPGMLFGRVVHPPSPGAVLLNVELDTVNALQGVVATVRDGSFLGVIADSEYLVVRALAKLTSLATWQEPETLPDMGAMPAFLRGQPVETTIFGEKKSDSVAVKGSRDFSADYSRPFIAHASIGPSCAVARYEPGALEIWTHSQGIFNVRADLAVLLDIPAESITLQHVEGAGCYGHNGADDAAADAALLARAVPGRPVHLQWTREDELGCAPFGAAMSVQLKASVNDAGRIVNWQHDVWSSGHSMRPGRSKIPVLMSASLLAKPYEKQVAINMPHASGGGAERNSMPLYDFEQWQAVSHRSLVMPIRTSSLRSLGAHCNVFAVESFMDEIAAGLEVDPLDFRLRHLSDARGRAVLEAVATMSGWRAREHKKASGEGRGMGIAFARYKNTGAWCAVVALIDAGQEVRVEKLWLAVDVGRVVNLDGVINQIEGGAIQTVSWVLREAVQFDRTRVLSNTWESYPILRFSEVPAVEVQVLDRPGEKSIGAGEPTHGPVAAAIANAVADALGVRVRHMPLSTDNITQAALAEEAV
ncbi:MAG: molybdopterin cofactor-binding domain-containing protein [Pseudomonadota bacterium]